ncbi:hypothetical protein BU17DRAFT_66247 [Hysterangium stoloniferum]|nr:hypothetical protein BU17DRAFT_66247 [Hysterangium stoloniferum]
MPLSANSVDVWVDELCQGETSYHDPPTQHPTIEQALRSNPRFLHVTGPSMMRSIYQTITSIYHCPQMMEKSGLTSRYQDTNTISNLREGVEELPPLASPACRGETRHHDPTAVVKMSGRPTNTTSNHPEGVEEQPPLVSSCVRAPDDEEHISVDHQHIPLSANDGEVRVDESFKGDTSYNDPPTVVQMAGRPTNTTSNHREGAGEQPPLVSPNELSSDQWDQINKTGMREIFRVKLRERWSCTEPGHDLCYRAPMTTSTLHCLQTMWILGLTSCHREDIKGIYQMITGVCHCPQTLQRSGLTRWRNNLPWPTHRRSTSNHREGIEGDIPDDHHHMPLSTNGAEVGVDVMCHGPPNAVKMLERCINTTANLREDVEELPPLESSYQTPDDGQNILSANYVEVSADEFQVHLHTLVKFGNERE